MIVLSPFLSVIAYSIPSFRGLKKTATGAGRKELTSPCSANRAIFHLSLKTSGYEVFVARVTYEEREFDTCCGTLFVCRCQNFIKELFYFFKQRKDSMVKQFTQRFPTLLVIETKHWKLHSPQLEATTCSRIRTVSSLSRQTQKTPNPADFHKNYLTRVRKHPIK